MHRSFQLCFLIPKATLYFPLNNWDYDPLHVPTNFHAIHKGGWRKIKKRSLVATQ